MVDPMNSAARRKIGEEISFDLRPPKTMAIPYPIPVTCDGSSIFAKKRSAPPPDHHWGVEVEGAAWGSAAVPGGFYVHFF